MRRHKETGTAVEEVIFQVAPGAAEPVLGPHDRFLQIPLIRDGKRVDVPTLEEDRQRLRHALVTLPWEGLKLSAGDPAITVLFQGAS